MYRSFEFRVCYQNCFGVQISVKGSFKWCFTLFLAVHVVIFYNASFVSSSVQNIIMYILYCLKAIKRDSNGIADVVVVTSFKVSQTLCYVSQASLGTVNTVWYKTVCFVLLWFYGLADCILKLLLAVNQLCTWHDISEDRNHDFAREPQTSHTRRVF